VAANVTRLYQAVLRDAAAPISIRLRRTFSEWVAGKGFRPIDAGRPRDEQEAAGGARLRVERRDASGRFTLQEPVAAGVLRTTVTYTESVAGMTGWVVVVVEQEGGGEQATAYAPGFLPAYLRTARITDGAVHLEDGPVVVDEEEARRFADTLTDRRRRVPVVAVSIDPRDTMAALERARRLCEMTAGAAIVARFADVRAQERFNDLMGESLRVFGGGVRTYLAPFDPAAERYPSRHRVMGGGTLRGQGDQALERLADGVVGEIARRPLPDDVQRTFNVVKRVLAGRAEPRDIAAAVAPPRAIADAAREHLRRRLMALTVRPAPPGAGPAPASAGLPGGGNGGGTGGGTGAGNGGGNGEANGGAKAGPKGGPNGGAGHSPEPEPAVAAASPRETSSAEAGGLDAPGLAQMVADNVVKELRTELESALTLAASPASTGEETAELSRQVRVLTAHFAGLRDLLTSGARGSRPAEPARPFPGDGDASPAQRLRELQEEHDLLLREYTEEVDNVRRLTARVRHLERKLAESGQPAYGEAPCDDSFEPDSLTAALDGAGERLTHVEVCDPGDAAQLDLRHPKWSRAWAAKAWDALRALDDFARARSSGEFSGGFFDWCANGSPGRYTIPTGMLAMRESQSVTSRTKFSTARTFRVPAEVDPSGKILMEAHIKLRAVGYPAPRMYFHDDSAGATGKIWIGYLGEHLPNTRTN